ncbi:hypothetical protein [Herbaspirillum sp.]|uniref:hypothetical protein n=1 Tax=Herbaspirillum sp. TaxID=1890675 RepID=UPI0034130981
MQGFFADANGVSRFLCGLSLMLAAGWSSAQTAAPEGAPAMSKETFEALEARAPLNQRYPAGSIKSREVAQKALAEADEDRNALAIRYIIDQRACYKKFLVSSCLEEARERKRVAESNIKQVEIEANTYQRQANVDERDQALAEQRKQDQADAARRLQEQQQKEADSARKVQESDAKREQVQQRIDQGQGQSPDYRIREHEAKVREQQAEDAARAPERAANAAAREQRIKDAEAHRQEVERKKAENERERAERKQRQAQPPAAPQ